jgi:hypothetical protein
LQSGHALAHHWRWWQRLACRDCWLHGGAASHHSLGRELKQTKAFRQDKSGITNGLEKSFRVIPGFLQVDRHADRIEGLVGVKVGVLIFFAVQLRGGERRGLFKKGANVRTIGSASWNGSTAGADWLRFVHFVDFSPTFKAAHNCTPSSV